MSDIDLLRERLQELRGAVAEMPLEGQIMYEDGGFHAPRLHAAVRSEIAPLVDVFSMNEDELQAHLGREVDLLDPRSVAQALGELRPRIPGPTIVVHTRHWALATGPGSGRFRAALAGGITAATARYVHGDELHADRVATIAGLEAPPEHRHFAERVVHEAPEPTVCVPALSVSVDHPTTIGLGDCFVGGFLATLAPTEGHA